MLSVIELKMKSLMVAAMMISAMAQGASRSPNVLLLTVDDMNWDSLGVTGCTIPGADGYVYPTTSPAEIYPIDFEEFVRTMQQKLASAGVKLDHFHIDYSYQDCAFDARNRKRTGLDFNRMVGAQKIIKSLQLDCGVIVNAYDDFSYAVMGGSNIVQEKETAENRAERNASGVDNTLEYFDGYVAAGGSPDTWIFQRWQPYPDVTGPETVRNTDMGVTRELVNKLK